MFVQDGKNLYFFRFHRYGSELLHAPFAAAQAFSFGTDSSELDLIWIREGGIAERINLDS